MKRLTCLLATFFVLLGLTSCGKTDKALMTVESGELSLDASGYASNDIQCIYEYIITNCSEFKVKNIVLACALVDTDGVILGTTNSSIDVSVGSGEKVRVKGSFKVSEYDDAATLRVDSITCKDEKDHSIDVIIEEDVIKNCIFDLSPVHNTINKMNNQYMLVIERLNNVFAEHGYRTLNPATFNSKIKDHEVRHYINDWVEVTISLESDDIYISKIGLLFRTENQTSGWQSKFFEIFEQIIPGVYSNASQYDVADAIAYYEAAIQDGYSYSWPEYRSEDSIYNVGEISCSVHKALGNIVVNLNLN